MDTHNAYDPHENSLDPDFNDYPNRSDFNPMVSRHRLRSIFRNYNTLFRIEPAIPRTAPGLGYIPPKDNPSPTSRSERIWIASTLLFNPVLKFALVVKEEWNHHDRDDPSSEFYWDCFSLGPNKSRWVFAKDLDIMGAVGILDQKMWRPKTGFSAPDSDSKTCKRVHLVRFHTEERLAEFKRSSWYMPMHCIVEPPWPDTEQVFEDTDDAAMKFMRERFADEGFSDHELKGILANYQDIDKMEMLFLGDQNALRTIYTRLGGGWDKRYIGWTLRKILRENGSFLR